MWTWLHQIIPAHLTVLSYCKFFLPHLKGVLLESDQNNKLLVRFMIPVWDEFGLWHGTRKVVSRWGMNCVYKGKRRVSKNTQISCVIHQTMTGWYQGVYCVLRKHSPHYYTTFKVGWVHEFILLAPNSGPQTTNLHVTAEFEIHQTGPCFSIFYPSLSEARCGLLLL